MGRSRFWDIVRRAETGPVCPEREFDTKVLWPKVKELVKTYDIKFDPDNLVPTDLSLADDVFKAGYELILHTGILCLDTEKIIKFEEEELKEAIRTLRIKSQRPEIRGKYMDATLWMQRKIEDTRPPWVHCGPAASPISETWAPKIYQSYAQEPIVDSLYFGTLVTVDGMPVKPKSPWEMRAERVNVGLMRQAAIRAGRPGMAISGTGSVSAAADVGASSEEYGYWKIEGREAKLKPQLKVDYENLARAANYMEYGGGGMGGGNSYIYGLAGGPETASVICIAGGFVGAVMSGRRMGGFAYNTEYTGTTDRVSIWASCIAGAGVNRSTYAGGASATPYIAYAGPCTSMNLYEIAARAIAVVTCGGDIGPGCGGRQGKYIDHCSGMEARWAAEVGHGVLGMKLEDANELVKTIVSKYEDRIKARNPPPGKPFPEIYDTDRLVPSREYMELYVKTKKELQNLGVDFEKYELKR